MQGNHQEVDLGPGSFSNEFPDPEGVHELAWRPWTLAVTCYCYQEHRCLSGLQPSWVEVLGQIPHLIPISLQLCF